MEPFRLQIQVSANKILWVRELCMFEPIWNNMMLLILHILVKGSLNYLHGVRWRMTSCLIMNIYSLNIGLVREIVKYA